MSKYRLWLLLSLAAPLDAAAIDLAAAYAAARLQSPEFAAAQEAVAAAQEGPTVARARLLPQMALQINQHQIRQTTTRTAGRESFAGSAYNHELTFRQALIREKDRLDVQIARLNVEVAELELEKSLSRVWLRVATAWVDEKFSTWRVKTLAEIAGVGESLAASAQKRFSRGESTLDFVAEASARSRLARARLQEAQDERLTAIRALELQIGSPPQTEAENELSFSGQQTDRQPMFAPPSTAYFLEHSPAIRALRLNEAIANRRVAKADAEHYPTVDLVGSASRAENDNASALGNTYRTARVGIQASIPLMSGGSATASVRQAIHEGKAARLRREAAEIETTLEIERSLQRHRSLSERRHALLDRVRSAQLQLQGAERNAAAGLKSLDTVLEAQESLADRRLDLQGIAFELIKLEAQILAALPPTDPAVIQWTKRASVHVSQTSASSHAGKPVPHKQGMAEIPFDR